jgi:hypothetical protein
MPMTMLLLFPVTLKPNGAKPKILRKRQRKYGQQITHVFFVIFFTNV